MSDGERHEALESRQPGHLRRPDFQTLEPPPEVDRLVLAEARRAIASVPRPAPQRFFPRTLPLALAATVVLAVATAVQLWGPASDAGAPSVPTQAADSAGSGSASDEPLHASRTGPMSDEPVIMHRLSPPSGPPRPAVRHPLPEAAGPAGPLAQADPASGDVAPLQDAHREGPAAWLRRIEQLQAQGRTQAAEREWREFRKAYPSYPVRGSAGPTR